MGKVIYARMHEIPWMRPENEWEAREGEPDSRYKLLSTNADDRMPTVLVAEFEPGHTQEAHSHKTSEILYILRGEVTIGDETASAGTMVYVEKDTRYGPLRAGVNGVSFLRVEMPV